METSKLLHQGEEYLWQRRQAGMWVICSSRERQIAKLWLENCMHGGRSAKKQAVEILSSPFLPQHHLDPVWCMFLDMCLGWHLASTRCPSAQHLSLALVLTQELCFSIWHLTLFLPVAPCALTQPCQLQHHLHVAGGTPGVETVPSVPVAAVAEYALHCPAGAVWCMLMGHVVGVSGALRKQNATTACTILPHCKSSPIVSQTSTEQTMLQVCWDILGGQEWLPSLQNLWRESWSQHRLSCLPCLGFPPHGHYVACSSAKLLCRLTVWVTGRPGVQCKIENPAWWHVCTQRDLGSHLKMQFVVYNQIPVGTGMCLRDCWKFIAEEGTQPPSPKPHADTEASSLSTPVLYSRI